MDPNNENLPARRDSASKPGINPAIQINPFAQAPKFIARASGRTDLEREILGGVLISNKYILSSLDKFNMALRRVHEYPNPLHSPIDPVIFSEPRNQEIWEMILKTFRERGAVDLMILGEALDAAGRYLAVGGAPYLALLEESIVSTLYTAIYAEMLIENWRNRNMAAIMDWRALLILHGERPAEVDSLRRMYERQLEPESDDDAPSGPESVSTIFVRAVCEIESNCARVKETKGTVGLPTGIIAIDQVTNGFKANQLIVIAGNTSVGKSLIASQIAVHAAKSRGARSLIFSLEMGRSEIVTRIMCQLSPEPLSFSAIMAASLNKHQRELMHGLAGEFGKLPIDIDDNVGGAVEVIEDRVAQAFAGGERPDMVIVDHAQLISARVSKGASEAKKVGEAANILKRLAMKYHIPIILLSQFSRESAKGKRKPNISDLKESGDIENAADVVILLYRDGVGSDAKTEWSIGKHRNGQLQTWSPIKFDARFMRFVDDDGGGIGGRMPYRE